MSRFLWVLLLFAFAPHVAAETIVVRAKGMLDVESGTMHSSPAIVVRDGKIVEVTSSSSENLPKEATLIDLGEAYILPGLIDTHVHLAWGSQDATTDARNTLLAGFTTVRNPGSTGLADIQLRNEIEAGKKVGPRMIVSGPGLGSKGGICDLVFTGEAAVETVTQAKEMVKKLAEQKVDFIKICAGGQVLPSPQDTTTTEMVDDIVEAIVNEAHANGLKVASHAQGPEAIIQSVRADVDSIEHAGMINEQAAQLMRKSDVYLVPTLYRLEWVLENAHKNNAPPATIGRLEVAKKQAYENIRKAIALGVPVAFGTDATVYPHGLNARELSVLVQLGMTPLQAIQSATIHASRLIGWDNKVGRILPGHFADMIAVSEDPLKNIRTLEQVRFVMKGGAVARRPE